MPATRVRDVYDDAIDYLVKHPEKLEQAWSDGACIEQDLPHDNPQLRAQLRQYPGSILFVYCTRRSHVRMPSMCGCLTLVKMRSVVDGGGDEQANMELTLQVRYDPRIPGTAGIDHLYFAELTTAQRRSFLQPFAEWQRRFDRELPRE